MASKIKKCPPFMHDYTRAHGTLGKLGFFKICRKCWHSPLI
jgi:hypothetical protein